MTDSADLGIQSPVIYPEGFVSAVANANGGTSASSSSTTTPMEEGSTLNLAKERHSSSSHSLSPEKEYFFGVRRWHPRWMQRLRNAKFFTLILSLNCLFEGALVSGEGGRERGGGEGKRRGREVVGEGVARNLWRGEGLALGKAQCTASFDGGYCGLVRERGHR